MQALLRENELHGRSRGEALAWRGILAIAAEPNPGRTDRYLEEALEADLSEASRHLVRAMLAETPRQCIDDIRLAIEHDPYSHIAHMTLPVVLLFDGRVAEAERHSWAVSTLFPRDPGPCVVLAMAAALRRDEDLAHEWLERSCERGFEPLRGVLEFIVSTLTLTARALDTADEIVPYTFEDVLGLYDEGARHSEQVLHQDLGEVMVLLPRCFRNAYLKLVAAASGIALTRDPDLVRRFLGDAFEQHPIAMLGVVKAEDLRQRGRFAEAELVYLQASRARQIVPLEKWTLASAIRLELALADDPALGTQVRSRATKNLRRLTRSHDLTTEVLEEFAVLGIERGMVEFVRVALHAWGGVAPGDPAIEELWAELGERTVGS